MKGGDEMTNNKKGFFSKEKLMAPNNLVIRNGEDKPTPDRYGFYDLKAGSNYPSGERIKLGDTVKIENHLALVCIKSISYAPHIGGRVHYVVDWGAFYEPRSTSEMRLVRRENEDISINRTREEK